MAYKSIHTKAEFESLMATTDDLLNKKSQIDIHYLNNSLKIVSGLAIKEALELVLPDIFIAVQQQGEKLYTFTAYDATQDGNCLYIE